MTITKHDRIALIPTRCDYCNRLFIFEPYDIHYREVGVECYDLKQKKCLKCYEQKYGVSYNVIFKRYNQCKKCMNKLKGEEI